jgi:hypothetical protein
MMDLPEELKNEFWMELQQFEQEKQMPFVTSVEQIGIAKGRSEGLREGLLSGIELALKVKFGAAGIELLPEIRQIQDHQILKAVLQALETATAPDDLRSLWSDQAAQ